jgi:uncharacterized protein (UPF0333 family)
MSENSTRSQASVEFLIMLAAVLMVVGAIIFMVYLSATGLGSSVGEEIDNTVSEVENLLMITAVGLGVQGVANA